MKNIPKKPTFDKLEEARLTQQFLYHPNKDVQEAAWKKLVKLREQQNG